MSKRKLVATAVFAVAVLAAPVTAGAFPIVTNPTPIQVGSIATAPFVNSTMVPSDLEGSAYIESTGRLWLADDNAAKLYEVDVATGNLLSVIEEPDFAAAPQFGGSAPATLARTDDLEALAYLPQTNELFAFAGSCCGTDGNLPTVFRLVSSGQTFVVDSHQELPAASDFSGAAGHPTEGLWVGQEKLIRPYDYATNTLGPAIALPITGKILGLDFTPDGLDLFVTSSTERLYRFNWATKSLVPGYDFDLTAFNILDSRPVSVVGNQIFVGDGYDGYGESDPLKYQIHIFDFGTTNAPLSSFTATPQSGVAPLVVQFADTSINGPANWSWDFGDGTSSTAQHPSHTYISPGTYTASLVVSNGQGSSISSQTIDAFVSSPPTADFTATPSAGTSPLVVSVDGSASSDADGTVVSYAWDFGDGTTATGVTASHTFAPLGTHTISLTVTDNSSATGTTTRTVDVTAGSGTHILNPVADSYVNSNNLTRNYGTAAEIRATLGYIYSGLLRFDLGVLNGPPAQAILRLYITNASDAGGTISTTTGAWDELTVTWPTQPTASGVQLSLGPTSTAGTWVELDITQLATGNGVLDLALLPESTNTAYYSSKEGTNPPQLVVTENAGPAAPTASFTASPTSGVGPLDVTFTDTSTGTPTSWFWDFGDGA
ncbi:MAG: PKD repeat protein, partial [Candidatus Poriferisodalaceae bacterium]